MSNRTTSDERSGVQVISRAVAILRELEAERDGLTIGEIADRQGLARTTVQRIAASLLDEKLLMPGGRRGRVKLGPLLVQLGANARLDMMALVEPVMVALSRELGETVDLSVLSGTSALFIGQVPGRKRLSAVSHIGDRFPLHSSANGKAMLCALKPAQRQKLLGCRLERETPATITDLTLLEAAIAEAQRAKVAFDREEHTLGVSAVGTWFTDTGGQVYAISLPIPTVRFEEGAHLIVPLLRARDEIVAAINA